MHMHTNANVIQGGTHQEMVSFMQLWPAIKKELWEEKSRNRTREQWSEKTVLLVRRGSSR